MGRTTRTFKLRLSPLGVDALIEAHCHLIRATRCVIAWGMTLHVAVDHLSSMPPSIVAARLAELDLPRLVGDTEHHVGASHRLAMIASHIVEGICCEMPGQSPPTLRAIYMLALLELVEADHSALLGAFARAQGTTGVTLCDAAAAR